MVEQDCSQKRIWVLFALVGFALNLVLFSDSLGFLTEKIYLGIWTRKPPQIRPCDWALHLYHLLMET